jgi:DNA-binding response OmpR family regulator
MTADITNVLVVEDNEVLRGLLRTTLERASFRVLLAADAESALGLFASAEQPIDMLISDVKLPGMNGVKLAQELRRRDPHLPILLVSGAFDEETGFPELDKPFTLDELRRKIAEVARAAAGRNP